MHRKLVWKENSTAQFLRSSRRSRRSHPAGTSDESDPLSTDAHEVVSLVAERARNADTGSESDRRDVRLRHDALLIRRQHGQQRYPRRRRASFPDVS